MRPATVRTDQEATPKLARSDIASGADHIAQARAFLMPAPSTGPSSTTSRPRRSPGALGPLHREIPIDDERQLNVSADVRAGPSTNLDETGPIDYLVVEFPATG